MNKAKVVFDESICLGCGYCEEFCPKGCIVITGKKFTPQGFLLPEFANPEKCNHCGICAWMCPRYAVKVYKLVEKEADAA